MALGQKVLLYKMTGLNCTLANVGIIFVRFLICWSDLELPGVFSQIHPLLSQPFFFPSFWLHQAACGILVSWPGIKPAPLALEAQTLNHWTTKGVPHSGISLKKKRNWNPRDQGLHQALYDSKHIGDDGMMRWRFSGDLQSALQQ